MDGLPETSECKGVGLKMDFLKILTWTNCSRCFKHTPGYCSFCEFSAWKRATRSQNRIQRYKGISNSFTYLYTIHCGFWYFYYQSEEACHRQPSVWVTAWLQWLWLQWRNTRIKALSLGRVTEQGADCDLWMTNFSILKDPVIFLRQENSPTCLDSSRKQVTVTSGGSYYICSCGDVQYFKVVSAVPSNHRIPAVPCPCWFCTF